MAFNQPPPYYTPQSGVHTVTTVTTIKQQNVVHPQQGAVPRPAVIIQPQYQSTTSQAGSLIGSAIGSAFRTSKTVVNSAAKEIVREADRYAESPLLNCLRQGSVIQLKSRVHNGFIRVLPDGRVDARGSFGSDYSAHFIITMRHQNIVVLRNGANQNFHLAVLSTGGVGTGIGDRASNFRIHETFRHFLTLRYEMTGQYFGIGKTGDVVPPGYLNENSEEAQFEVHLVYSPFGHSYIPTH